MRTRKWVGWAIIESPSSDSIASVLKRVFLDWGVPEACLWDNGKDFRCEWLEGTHRKQGEGYRIGELAEGMRGVMGTLGRAGAPRDREARAGEDHRALLHSHRQLRARPYRNIAGISRTRGRSGSRS